MSGEWGSKSILKIFIFLGEGKEEVRELSISTGQIVVVIILYSNNSKIHAQY